MVPFMWPAPLPLAVPLRTRWVAGLRRLRDARGGLVLTLVWLALITGACRGDTSKTPTEPLIVYCSVDEGFARSVFRVFRERTGVAKPA